MIYFKVLDGNKSCNGGDATWRIGRWMPKRDVNPCNSGYHLCRPSDLVKWIGKTIYIAEGRGKMVECEDKVVFEQVRIVRRIGAWDEKTARLFACWCVRQVWNLLADERSKNAVRVSERFARGRATEEELDAARDAAWAAAWAAARVAARVAAWDAARVAAWDAARVAAWDAARAAAWVAAWDAGTADETAARVAQTKKLMRVLGVSRRALGGA